MGFATRYGYKPVREIIQKESINEALKNRLWNCIGLCIFQNYQKSASTLRGSPVNNSNLNSFFSLLFHLYFKKRIDQIPHSFESTVKEIETLFFTKYKWYEIYDFIDFIIENFPFNSSKENFILLLNDCLTSENAAYRVVDNRITEITSEQEIQSIEEALENTNPHSGVQKHLKQALQLMSDQKNPDYRNSIKESISAVESICKIVTNDEKATLGQALKNIKRLPPTLQLSMDKLYGYTSREDGIRHAMLEESNLTYIDAKFMLVACTNFINYLIEKTKD